MRGRTRLVDVRLDRGDGAEAVGSELGVVDADIELVLEPGHDLEQAEAVHDAAGQQVEIVVEVLDWNIGHELLDDERLDFRRGLIHWHDSSLVRPRPPCGRLFRLMFWATARGRSRSAKASPCGRAAGRRAGAGSGCFTLGRPRGAR